MHNDSKTATPFPKQKSARVQNVCVTRWQGIFFFCRGNVKQIVLIHVVLFFSGFLNFLKLVSMQGAHGPDS